MLHFSSSVVGGISYSLAFCVFCLELAPVPETALPLNRPPASLSLHTANAREGKEVREIEREMIERGRPEKQMTEKERLKWGKLKRRREVGQITKREEKEGKNEEVRRSKR